MPAPFPGAVHFNTRAQTQALGNGEASKFLKCQPRRVTVHALSLCQLWCLAVLRLRDLSRHHSPIALKLMLAIAPKRVAVT